MNAISTVIVAPLTSTDKKYPTRVPVTFLNGDRSIVLDQLRTVDRVRLVKRSARLTRRRSGSSSNGCRRCLPSNLRKIISGGQTGADRAAWDSAIEAGIAMAGSFPRASGETVRFPPISRMTETASGDPMERTRLNVIDSDATLLFSHGPPTGGSRLTAEFAAEHLKPLLHVDFSAVSLENGLKRAAEWIEANKIGVLNIAGPRASEDPLIYQAVREFLNELFVRIR